LGPEIIYAFFAVLGLLFWGAIKVIWRVIVLLLNIILIPYMVIKNYFRVHFWKLPKQKVDTAIFKKTLF